VGGKTVDSIGEEAIVVDQKTRESMTAGEKRPARTWMTALIVGVVAAVAFGTWALTQATTADPAATAGDLVDRWIAGVNASDGEAVAALFAADGILDMLGRESQGRIAIAADVNRWSPNTENWERMGDVVETEAGTFTFDARGDYFDSPHTGDGEIELDGDTIGRLTWHGATPAE
jgi:hypothetical protein